MTFAMGLWLMASLLCADGGEAVTLEQITALAKEAGLHSALILSIYGNTESLTSSETVELKRIHDFAKLIEDATREECAKVCENLIAGEGTSDHISIAKEVANFCAEAIRSET